MRNSTVLALPDRAAATHTAPHAGWLLQLRAWCELSITRHRERRRLLALDDRELRDVGIAWVDARIEASKPFWR